MFFHSFFHTANLTLNPSTAHPQLYVSSDLKSVTWKGMSQQVNGTPLRYDVLASVLSHESFNSGKLCWEVEVVEKGEWWEVGIVRESANRNEEILLEPRGGYWGGQWINGKHQSITQPRTDLTLCHSPRRIWVSLDYLEGLVAFFDGNTNAEIFTFPKANFAGEKMHAWFLIFKWKGQLLLHPWHSGTKSIILLEELQTTCLNLSSISSVSLCFPVRCTLWLSWMKANIHILG